jgi:tRNA-2-methylthio-N6-dimethylallyladenosine synthase
MPSRSGNEAGRPRPRRTLVGEMDSATATPESPDAARTYRVRTYGCQMNVHDSERLAGLL